MISCLTVLAIVAATDDGGRGARRSRDGKSVSQALAVVGHSPAVGIDQLVELGQTHRRGRRAGSSDDKLVKVQPELANVGATGADPQGTGASGDG